MSIASPDLGVYSNFDMHVQQYHMPLPIEIKKMKILKILQFFMEFRY